MSIISCGIIPFILLGIRQLGHPQDLLTVPMGKRFADIQLGRTAKLDTNKSGRMHGAPDWVAIFSDEMIHEVPGKMLWFFDADTLIAAVWHASTVPAANHLKLKEAITKYLGPSADETSEVYHTSRWTKAGIEYRLFKSVDFDDVSISFSFP